MGIKNFKQFLLSKTKDPIKKISFSDANKYIKSICIDINIFIYKYITAIRKTGKDLMYNNKISSHIIGLKNQINKFEELGIDIIYVFDGKSPKQKNNVLKERENIKKKAEKIYEETKSIKAFQQSFYITKEILDDAKEYIKSRGKKYIDVEQEADIVCASLVKQKIVDCVYSTDYDILVYGANYLIINMDYKKKYFEYISLKYILKELYISHEQLVNIIVISGCDYCIKHEHYTLNNAYKLIKNDNIINDIIDNNKKLMDAKNIFMKKYKIKKSDIKK